jgi:hypothetical protein
MEYHLNQSVSYKKNNCDRCFDEVGKIEDDIIAITLRIVISVYIKEQNLGRPVRRVDVNAIDSNSSNFTEDKTAFISHLFKILSENPRAIRMQKTVISLIITAITKKQKLIHPNGSQLKYNPVYLKECLKDRTKNNILDIMKSRDFDRDIFGLTIKLFKWYDLDTKLVFLEFYRQVIEEGCLGHNISDFATFKDN